jgi:hypothetical protein
MFEDEGGESPVAPTVKIINISICDPTRVFFYQLSSCAKLLDWLSEKHQELFCVSAGNIKSDINLDKPEAELNHLDDEELTKHTLKKIHGDIRNRRLCFLFRQVSAD